MTLLEQIDEINKKTADLVSQNPGITNVWWEIMDADLEEMKELESGLNTMDYCKPNKRMRLNPFHLAANGAVIFIFSKPVKVRQRTEIIEIIEIENAEV